MTRTEEAARILGDRARRDVPLGPLTTYRVGGVAALFVEARDEDDLRAVSGAVRAAGIATLVVGKGSNLLVADRGFPGIAVVLADAFAEVAWLPARESLRSWLLSRLRPGDLCLTLGAGDVDTLARRLVL